MERTIPRVLHLIWLGSPPPGFVAEAGGLWLAGPPAARGRGAWGLGVRGAGAAPAGALAAAAQRSAVGRDRRPAGLGAFRPGGRRRSRAAARVVLPGAVVRAGRDPRPGPEVALGDAQPAPAQF